MPPTVPEIYFPPQNTWKRGIGQVSWTFWSHFSNIIPTALPRVLGIIRLGLMSPKKSEKKIQIIFVLMVSGRQCLENTDWFWYKILILIVNKKHSSMHTFTYACKILLPFPKSIKICQACYYYFRHVPSHYNFLNLNIKIYYNLLEQNY